MVNVAPWLMSFARLASQLNNQQKFPHGLLCYSACNVGQLELARHLAKLLLCEQLQKNLDPCNKCPGCTLIAAGNHPDLLIIDAYRQHDQDKKNLSININSIRSAISKLQLCPQRGQGNVILLLEAQYLTEAASNALLKILEEPPSSSYLLLTASDKKKLLPTIVSRCQSWFIPVPTLKQSIDWLITQGIVAEQAKLAIRVSENSPYKARQFIINNGLKDRDQLIQLFQKVLSAQANLLTLSELIINQWQLFYSLICDLYKLKFAVKVDYITHGDVINQLLALNQLLSEKQISLLVNQLTKLTKLKKYTLGLNMHLQLTAILAPIITSLK